MKRKPLWGVLFLLLAGAIGLLFVYSQTEPTPRLAPLNPEFVTTMERIKSGTFQWAENYGYLPGPLDVSFYKSSLIDDPTIHVGYPASYDLRILNRLTAVRDQGGCGDFDGDGKVDILYWNSLTARIVVWYMNGAVYAGFDYLDTCVADTNWRIAGVGNFNLDQKPDIVWRNYSTGQNAIWFLDGVKYKSCEFLDTISDMNWVIVNR